jgi:hypothetical protein
MSTTSTTYRFDPHADFWNWMPDYCPRCNPAGAQADSCVRKATMAEPHAVGWAGGKYVTCHYVCDCCGHRWKSRDWPASAAGFDPKQQRRKAG